MTGLHLSPRVYVLSYHFYFSTHFLMPGMHLTLHHDLLRRHRGERVRQWPLGRWRGSRPSSGALALVLAGCLEAVAGGPYTVQYRNLFA